mmetsp:Transcript_30278/g.45866  ORF Transcript_30278/g.45866 Transcript_30278/m.45866 type:complete len:817 (+) Transcript_30278:98-2548(+)
MDFDDNLTSPSAVDDEYSRAMDKLNATLERASSTRGSFGSRVGPVNVPSAPPPQDIYYNGGASCNGSVSSSIRGDQSVPFVPDDYDAEYDPRDQLPSIEEVRTSIAVETAPLSGRQRRVGGRRHGAKEEIESRRSSRNRWMIAFVVLVASLIGIIIGLAIGFRGGEEYEHLKEEAEANLSPPTSEPLPNPPAPSTPTRIPAQKQKEPTSEPTVKPGPSPTDEPSRLEEVQQWLIDEEIALPTDFDDESSSQYKASKWIADDDKARIPLPQNIGENSVEFLERYVMGVFHYAFGSRWDKKFLFSTPTSVCNWNYKTQVDETEFLLGVACNRDDSIVSIHIPSNNLKGSLIRELGFLSSLSYLALNHNALSGSLPTQLEELTALTYLALHYNQITGTLPQFIGNFENLRVLGLGENKLEGSIPTQWNSLTNLKTFGLDDNSIEGDLSVLGSLKKLERVYFGNNKFDGSVNIVNWGELTQLQELDLVENNLNGTVPASLFDLPHLQVLSLGKNWLAGELPSNIPSSSPLKYLSLHQNSIENAIPTSMGNLVNLTHLDLSGNSFTGAITHQFGTLVNLNYLFLSNNPGLKRGGIPQFLSKLTKLKDLSLAETRRVAAIPETLFENLKDLTLLDLSNNELSGPIPSQLGDLPELSYLLVHRNPDLDGEVPTSVQNLGELAILMIDQTGIKGNLNILCDRYPRKIEVMGADCSFQNDTSSDIVACSCCQVCCGDLDDDLQPIGANCHDEIYFGQLDPMWENSYARKEYQFDGEMFEDVELLADESGENEDDEGDNLGATPIGKNDTLGAGEDFGDPDDLGVP